jgi:hypothetical protein
MRCSSMWDNGESVRWFTPFTMTWVFMGGARRIQWCFTVHHVTPKTDVMLTGGRHLTV